MANSDQFYIDLRDEVGTLLSELGTSYQVRASGVYNKNTLKTGTGETRDVTGIVADQSSTFSFLPNTPFLDKNPEWLSTKNLILTASSEPLPNEEVLVDGKWFPLSKVNTIKPAEIIVIYILDVSK